MNTLSSQTRWKWLSIAMLAAAFLVYATTDFSLGGSSPLGLLLVTTGGWLLRFKEPIGGNLLLFFGGAALLLFPFMYDASFAYTPLAMPVVLDGVNGLWQWWNKEQA